MMLIMIVTVTVLVTRPRVVVVIEIIAVRIWGIWGLGVGCFLWKFLWLEGV